MNWLSTDWKKRGRNGEQIILLVLLPNLWPIEMEPKIFWNGIVKFLDPKTAHGLEESTTSSWISPTIIQSDPPNALSTPSCPTPTSTPPEPYVYRSSTTRKIGNQVTLLNSYWKAFRNYWKMSPTPKAQLSKILCICTKITKMSIYEMWNNLPKGQEKVNPLWSKASNCRQRVLPPAKEIHRK